MSAKFSGHGRPPPLHNFMTSSHPASRTGVRAGCVDGTDLLGWRKIEDRQMNAKQVNLARKRLAMESEKLIRSIHRNRAAAEEITTEDTEDEAELATSRHTKQLLQTRHER